SSATAANSAQNQGIGSGSFHRCTARLAASTMEMIPAKIAALTTQVEPNNNDMLVTPRVSISRNAAPMRNSGPSNSPQVPPIANVRGTRTAASASTNASTAT